MRKGITKSSLTKKSQVTIPKVVRDAIGVGPGDQVEFLIDEAKGQRSLYMVPRESRLRANFGAVKPKQKPEDFKKLREEFEQGVASEGMKEIEQE
jgi:antitoxin PrlF